MAGEFSIDTDFISWFQGFGPATVLGPCPHRCLHRSMRVIAWGADKAHYTLDECSDCRCRAWMPVYLDAGGKPRPVFADAVWLQVEELVNADA